MFINSKISNNILKVIIFTVYVSSVVSNIAKLEFNILFVISIVFLTAVFYKHLNLSNIDKINISLLKFLPLFHYFVFFLIKFISNQDIFWDGQLFFFYILCNRDGGFLGEYTYQLSTSNSIPCPETSLYGPLHDLLIFNFDPFLSSILLFIISISLFLYYYLKLELEDMTIISLFLLSSSFEFLIFSLNPDIFVFLFLIIFFKNFDNFNLFLWLIILSLLTQFKIFPIGILGGLTFLYLLKKSYKKFFITFLFSLLNSIILIKFYILDSSYIPIPDNPSRSFGLYTDYLIYMNIPFFESVPNSFLFLGVIVAVLFIFFIFNRLEDSFFSSFNNYENIFLVFYPLVLIVNLFTNYGYKFVFNFFLIFIFLKIIRNNNFKIYIISLLFFIPIINFTGYGYDPSALNNFYFFYSRVGFYLLNMLFVICFVKIANKLFTINYMKK